MQPNVSAAPSPAFPLGAPSPPPQESLCLLGRFLPLPSRFRTPTQSPGLFAYGLEVSEPP